MSTPPTTQHAGLALLDSGVIFEHVLSSDGASYLVPTDDSPPFSRRGD